MLTNAQRTEDYRNGSYKRTVMNPEPADNAPQFLKDYYDYYKTKRGYHHLMCNEKISLTFAHMKKRYCTKDHWPNNAVRPISHSHTYIFNFLIRHKIAGFHPKNLSAMKRAGNRSAACKYRFRVCFSLYIR